MIKVEKCKKIISILILLFILYGHASTIAIEADVKNSTANSINSTPEFYGTVGINLKVGDILDVTSPIFRIFAKDFYDGDLTQSIRIIENTVNTSVEGSYNIKYSVTNSAGVLSEINVPVIVSNSQERSIQRKLYKKENTSNIDLVGRRGNYHDRQNLGIYLEAGASVKVRTLTEGLKISGQFLNDDQNTEATFSITNNWTNITPKYDSVPFIKSTGVTTDEAVIEINIENIYKNDSLVKTLDYYLYGDNEQEFLNKWGKSQNSFAVMEDDGVTFLVPYKDKDNIIVEDNSKKPYYFETIKDLFDFYKDLFKMYNAFFGLETYPAEKIDQNVKTKYFVKANKHGYGMAYYSDNHTAYNGDNIQYYLYKNWLILHELGHGYDDFLTSGNLKLSEAANNIFAYYYEQKYLTEEDGGWLGKIPKKETALNNARKKVEKEFNEILNGTYSGTDQYQVRLYMMINVLNKIGPEKGMSELHKQARRDKNASKKIVMSDFIAKSFSESAEYNLIPYFESWKISIADNLKQEIREKDYPIIYYLRDLVDTDGIAQKIQKELNLEGMYSLVSNEELKKYNLNGAANINLSKEDYNKLKGYNLVLKSGKDVFVNIQIEETNISIENIPVGVYEIEDTNDSYDIAAKYLIVKEDKITTMSSTLNNPELAEFEDKTIEKVEFTIPNKVTYTKGEELDFSGLSIKVFFKDGTTKTTDVGYNISGYNKNRIGKQTVTIIYKDYSTTFEVEVLEGEENKGSSSEGENNNSSNIQNVNIVPPSKVKYTKGEKLDLDGLNIIAIYNDNSVEMVKKGYTVSGYNKNKIGKQTITIKYAGYQRSYEVRVFEKSSQSSKEEVKDIIENNKTNEEIHIDKSNTEKTVRFEFRKWILIAIAIFIILIIILIILSGKSKKIKK